MPSIVAVNFWLRGPGLNSGELALRSRQRGGILDISPWWQPRYYARFSYCMHPLCADPRLPRQHQIWFGWQILSGSGARTVLANSTLLVLKTEARGLCLTWSLRGCGERGQDEASEALFLVVARTTRPRRIKRQRVTVYFTGVMGIPRSSVVIWNPSKWHQMKCEIPCAVQRLQKGDLEFFYLKMKSVQICAERCHHRVASACHVVTI